MGKLKKFTGLSIRSITGGKDPVRLVDELIVRYGFDPGEALKESTADHQRWMLAVNALEELEILVEGIKSAHDTTIYMGINVITVPIRGANEMLCAALEIADGLVGIKVSLVGHYLVLSATLAAHNASADELDYYYKLIIAQKDWFKEVLMKELQWESVVEP